MGTSFSERFLNLLTSLMKELVALFGKAAEGIRFLPLVPKSRTLLRLWLTGARGAQVTLVLTLLLVATGALPALADKAVALAIPETTAKKQLFGLLTSAEANPGYERCRVANRVILWGTACGAFVLLLFSRLPGAVRVAGTSRGDDLAGDELSALGRKAFGTSFVDSLMPGEGGAETVVSPGGEMSPVGPGGRYRVAEELGSGAMGVVYRAHDAVLERDVAVKELHAPLSADRELVSRFRQEAKTLARLDHPHIVRVFDFLEERGRGWIIMELVSGGDLDGLLRTGGALSVEQAGRLGVLMAGAMAYAHSKGVVHRDFKPSNVLMNESGEPKISDFGLAKLAQSGELTQAGSVLGSPAYMSPEQARGEGAEARSDIYALGAVLYRMLSGRPPFEAGDMAGLLLKHIQDEPLPLHETVPGIPKEMEDLVLEMLVKKPEGRPQKMEEVAERLGRLGPGRHGEGGP
jgi:serine/threonine-protein kinase